MAMQSGVGLSKILIIAGAGYTGAIVLKDRHLADILRDLLEILSKRKPKSEDGNDHFSDDKDVLDQVRRLAMEVRQLATARPITVFNGESSQLGSITSLAVPAAALGALGYGYMWWKGLSFTDLMYVTKRNMANAVSSLTKNLEQVSAALAATKRHLTQRIENLDGKLDEQKEMSKLIKNEVTEVRADISQIGYDLETLQKLVNGLDGKIGTLEDKQMKVYVKENITVGLRVLKKMNQANVNPDSMTSSHLISYCECEEDIIKYYEELQSANVQVTKHVYMALINVNAKFGQFEKAKQVVPRPFGFKDERFCAEFAEENMNR